MSKGDCQQPKGGGCWRVWLLGQRILVSLERAREVSLPFLCFVLFFFFPDILCCCFTKPREPLHLIPMDIRQLLRLLGVTHLSESVQEKSLKIHCPAHENVAT